MLTKAFRLPLDVRPPEGVQKIAIRVKGHECNISPLGQTWHGPQAAQHDGAIRAAMEKLGQPVGVNDMHLAAHVHSEGLVAGTSPSPWSAGARK